MKQKDKKKEEWVDILDGEDTRNFWKDIADEEKKK